MTLGCRHFRDQRSRVAKTLSDHQVDPETVAFHTAMLENNTRILYAGAEKRPDYNVPGA